MPGLLYVPAEGATAEMIAEEERAMGRRLSPQHVAVLRRWNGLDLEVLRLYGCGDLPPRIRRLAENQRLDGWEVEGTVIGSDPAGFMYVEDDAGNILSLDHDGGDIKILAADIDDFFGRLVFGEDAHLFAGDDWKEELRSHGLL
jgi:hypothetical protein